MHRDGTHLSAFLCLPPHILHDLPRQRKKSILRCTYICSLEHGQIPGGQSLKEGWPSLCPHLYQNWTHQLRRALQWLEPTLLCWRPAAPQIPLLTSKTQTNINIILFYKTHFYLLVSSYIHLLLKHTCYLLKWGTIWFPTYWALVIGEWIKKISLLTVDPALDSQTMHTHLECSLFPVMLIIDHWIIST